jgi:hypothetical protein
MATATLALTEQYPEEMERREVYDLDFATDLKEVLKQLAVNARDSTEREKWKKQSVLLALYSKKTENINEVITRYGLGKRMKHEEKNIGRLVAEGGVGLQTFCRDVRNALGGHYYHDLDIVNALPTILSQMCAKRGWLCDHLNRYIESREEVISDVMDLLRREGSVREEDLRSVAKERVIAIYTGGSADGLTPFVRQMAEEAFRIRGNILNAYGDELKWIPKTIVNRAGKAVSWVYQTEERKCLMAIARALEARGRRMDVFIHDGGLVRKREGEAEFPKAMLREIEEDVFRETGYRVALAVKPMTTSLERTGGTDNEYAERKRQFEETGWKGAIYFKIRHPAVFGSVLLDKDNEYAPLVKSDLIQNEEDNLLGDGEPFIKRWLADPSKKEYLRVDFAPKVNLPDNVFNLFKGFANVPMEGGDLSSFYEILNIIGNHDAGVVEWLVKWCGHIIQKPSQKTNVCIVVQGKQGVGKDTFFDAVVGGILGKSHYFSTTSPENNVFAKFNSAIENRIVVKFEEANFHTNNANKEKLKGLITGDDIPIEHKGMKTYTIKNVVNVVMTTNNQVPVVLEDEERRMVLLKASEERRNDLQYFGQLRQRMAENLSAFHPYLLNLDLTGFDPRENRPLTEFYNDTRQCFIPYHARWLQRQIILNDGGGDSFRWSAHTLYTNMKENSPFALTETTFGRDMRDNYVDTGVIQKHRVGAGNEYRVEDIPRLREFLEQKGWWVDY